jgi:hypothetical protein
MTVLLIVQQHPCTTFLRSFAALRMTEGEMVLLSGGGFMSALTYLVAFRVNMSGIDSWPSGMRQ